MAARIVELEDSASPAVGKQTIFLCTPAYGCKLTVQYLQCLLQSQLALTSAGYGLTIDMLGNESLITRARNILVKRFLQSGATHLLFIDADISWHPEAILRLLRKNEGVVSTCYPKKHLDWAKIEARLQSETGEPIQQVGLDFNVNVTEKEVQVKDGFIEVLDAATGFMLVRKSVIEKMYRAYEKELLVQNDLLGAQKTIPDYVAIFDCMIDPTTRRPLSEDFAFSRRWQQLGGKVYMDLLMPLGHTGGFHYEGSTDVLANAARTSATKTEDVTKDQVSTQSNKKTVLCAIIATSEVALGFCMSMTRLLAALHNDGGFLLQVNVFPDKNRALDHMEHNKSYDMVLILDSMLSVDEQTVLNMLHHSSPFRVALYPTADSLNWTNVDKEKSAREQVMQYDVLVDEDKKVVSAPLGVAKLSREVVDYVRDRMDPRGTYCKGQRRLWLHDGVLDDRRLYGDEMFCRLWGKEITVETGKTVTRLGHLTFQGSLLARQKIR